MNNRKKILIIDLDDCAITPQTDNDTLLSEALINFATHGNYDGFYACTHRSRPALRNIKIKLNEYSSVKHINSENLFTSRIIQNFSDATGLSCFAVSTPNDAAENIPDNIDSCGSGYKNIILPFETAVFESSDKSLEEKINDEKFEVKIEYTQSPVSSFNNKTKNPQLEQITSHVKSMFPQDSEILLDYIDDNMDLCQSATTITSLPDGITLNCYQHKAADDKNRIELIGTAANSNQFVLDFEVNENTVNQLIQDRCSAEPIIPELVKANEVRKPEAYNRFQDLDVKDKFRINLLKSLHGKFLDQYPEETANQLIQGFESLARSLEDQGAVIFGDMINTDNFVKLIASYSKKLSTDGSKSWIHSYINLGNHPDFLSDHSYNGAFVHPLLMALIAYGAGGPIRLVDARGKDAEPLAVQAQDNMLHIDNTPFRKEYKVILTWERGKPSGPKGQNFVFIPGTHKGVRNCKVTNSGEAWSTEDASIFITENAIESVFQMQKDILGVQTPEVVEATHPTKPLTTVFEAGALVHHRYRTQEKNVPRSCVIAAFHRAQDNPGQFLSDEHLNNLPQNDLLRLLMGKHSDNTDELFINAILSSSELLANKINEISNENGGGTQLIPFNKRELHDAELQKWKATVTSAPTVEVIKADKKFFHLGDKLSSALLCEMMKFDKHGPIDLILFGDGHEEIRKWARNRIREMPLSKLEERLITLVSRNIIQQPGQENLLTPGQLKDIADHLVSLIDNLPGDVKANAHLDQKEKISSESAFRSMRQLIDDLGEAIIRCTSRQAFISTSLFLFWACDELSRLLVGPQGKPDVHLMKVRSQLLSNYISTNILVEKQIAFEKQEKQELVFEDKSDVLSVKANCTFFASTQQQAINNNHNGVEIANRKVIGCGFSQNSEGT